MLPRIFHLFGVSVLISAHLGLRHWLDFLKVNWILLLAGFVILMYYILVGLRDHFFQLD